MKDLNAALISSIGFLLLCVATGVTYCVVEFRRLFPANPAPTPEPVEPHWADLVVPLDRIETVDDILAELETPVPPAPPIIPGRTQPGPLDDPDWPDDLPEAGEDPTYIDPEFDDIAARLGAKFRGRMDRIIARAEETSQ